MLSNTCKYAIRSVLYLAVNSDDDKKFGIKQISKDLNLPSPFLGKILQGLVKHKFLASTKGPNGGFCLGKSAEQISLMDVVKATDGLDVFYDCFLGLNLCDDRKCESACPVHGKSKVIRKDMWELFEATSFASLATDVKLSGTVLCL